MLYFTLANILHRLIDTKVLQPNLLGQDKREVLYLKAIEILQVPLPIDKLEIANIYMKLENIYESKLEYRKCEESYTHSLDMLKEILPLDQLDIFNTYLK